MTPFAERSRYQGHRSGRWVMDGEVNSGQARHQGNIIGASDLGLGWAEELIKRGKSKAVQSVMGEDGLELHQPHRL